MVQRLEDLGAFQLSVKFKLEVYRLIRESPRATGDFKFKAQLSDSAAGVESCLTEGWYRYVPGEIVTFLRYSRASLAEAERWLHDGVARGCFERRTIESALDTAGRCGAALTNFRKSVEPYMKKKKTKPSKRDNL